MPREACWMWKIGLDRPGFQMIIQMKAKLRFERIYTTIRTNSDESRYLRNGTSDHRNEKTKTLCNRKYPPKPRKTHLRNHFCPLESGFLAIATYKTRVFSNALNSRFLKFGILNRFIHTYAAAKTDPVANFVELGHVETCSVAPSRGGL